MASDGSLWTWGYNIVGDLGLGDTVDRLTPTHLLPPSGYRYSSIDADAYGDFALATLEQVPEPGSLSLLAAGIAIVARRRRV
ncbi:MAG: PEP-CTERM sorting domain-containing protein [Tepidisphaeraceae bacterium]